MRVRAEVVRADAQVLVLPTVASIDCPHMTVIYGVDLPMSVATRVVAPAWTFGIHDHAIAAWVYAIAYVIAIGACIRAWRRERNELIHSPAQRQSDFAPRFWLVVAALLALLAINKPLDLHNLITDCGRQWARAGGWYENRRSIQVAFAIAVGAAALLALLLTALRLGKRVGRYALALVGLWLLAAFIGLRVASFHHVDRWLGTRLRGVKLHWIVESVAIATITAGAIFPFRRRPPAGTAGGSSR